MAKNFKNDDIPDNDPTDELPILTDVIPENEIGRSSSMRLVPADDKDSGTFAAARDTAAAPDHRAAPEPAGAAEARRIAALEAEMESLEQRWRETSSELAERDAQIDGLRATLDERDASLARGTESAARAAAELEHRDDEIARLRTAIEAAQANVNTLEDTARALEQQIVTLESTAAETQTKAQHANEADSTQRLREALATLSQHIENRNGIWRRQQAELDQKSTRIRELELELAQRQARQQAAERHAEVEVARGRELRTKLAAAMQNLERARAAATDHLDLQAEQLRQELRRAVALQTHASGDTEDLRRLEDLEAAIRKLESEMDGTVAGATVLPEEAPQPARLVCLTGDDLGTLPLDGATFMIGRGGHCGIRIATHYVSREHARLTTTDGHWVIEDLGSRNGVFVNAVRVERQTLDDNDLITIGDTQFRYQAGGESRPG